MYPYDRTDRTDRTGVQCGVRFPSRARFPAAFGVDDFGRRELGDPVPCAELVAAGGDSFWVEVGAGAVDLAFVELGAAFAAYPGEDFARVADLFADAGHAECGARVRFEVGGEAEGSLHGLEVDAAWASFGELEESGDACERAGELAGPGFAPGEVSGFAAHAWF